jgi:hypothetical protein
MKGDKDAPQKKEENEKKLEDVRGIVWWGDGPHGLNLEARLLEFVVPAHCLRPSPSLSAAPVACR